MATGLRSLSAASASTTSVTDVPDSAPGDVAESEEPVLVLNEGNSSPTGEGDGDKQPGDAKRGKANDW